MRAWKMGWLSPLVFVAAATSISRPDLVEVLTVNPRIHLDLRYATTNNFLGEKIYSAPKCFLRRATAQKLSAVQTELEPSGLGLKVFDAYRPLSAQRKLWELRPDTRYVADPAKGSRHNRGAAVDVTRVKADGTELQMGTGFDDFTEKAHRNFKDLPSVVLKNRQRLARVMEKHGFIPLRTEWWHFDDADWPKYEVLDVGFSDLEGISR